LCVIGNGEAERFYFGSEKPENIFSGKERNIQKADRVGACCR